MSGDEQPVEGDGANEPIYETIEENVEPVNEYSIAGDRNRYYGFDVDDSDSRTLITGAVRLLNLAKDNCTDLIEAATRNLYETLQIAYDQNNSPIQQRDDNTSAAANNYGNTVTINNGGNNHGYVDDNFVQSNISENELDLNHLQEHANRFYSSVSTV